jgi:hypothetical protein
MHIAYFDESGDDGFPVYSSPLFALSACYLHYLDWKPNFEALLAFRRQLKQEYGLPVKLEVHARFFLLNKNPYRQFAFSNADRIAMVGKFCRFVATLRVRFVNALIVKPRILMRDYEILDWALKATIQRIENDLNPIANPTRRFLMITDEGRVGKMRSTTRRMQRINYIPSRFGNRTYRSDIQTLIEDPLPKNSRDSYFIQICDLVASVVYLHGLTLTGTGRLSNRMAGLIGPDQARLWMDELKPVLNLKASGKDPHGIFIHPGI